MGDMVERKEEMVMNDGAFRSLPKVLLSSVVLSRVLASTPPLARKREVATKA